MTNLAFQLFQNKEIRFVGTADRPEWVAADILAILYPEADPRNYSNYLSKVQPEWKGKQRVPTLGGTQAMATIYEPGLYALITRSNSPIVVPFQKWMFEEVLPKVRHDGFYTAPTSIEAEAREDRDHLYIISNEGEGVCKIGRSKDPDRRVKSLTTGSHSELKLVYWFKNQGGSEKQMHSLLSDYKIKGEWFDDCILSIVNWSEIEGYTEASAIRSL